MLSVTQVLKLAGLIDATWYTEHARDKGTAVHAACAIVARGDEIEPQSIAPEIAGRLAAFERWRSEMSVAILRSEFRVEHPLLGYCGHPDLLIEWDGKRGIVDIKPSVQPWHWAQLAGYRMALEREHGRLAAWVLVLRNDGTYQFVRDPDPRAAERLFTAALLIARWKEATCPVRS